MAQDEGGGEHSFVNLAKSKKKFKSTKREILNMNFPKDVNYRESSMINKEKTQQPCNKKI